MSETFRVLSLDGGGIRGAFAAAFLSELERRLDGPIGRYFDLVAGTSTGGIIATALALGESAQRIEQLYREQGARIFTRHPSAAPWWARSLWTFLGRRRPPIDPAWAFGCKYRSDILAEVLGDVFGARTLESARTSRLVVPAVDMARAQTVVFKTPHLPGMVRDRRRRAVDIVLGTTAAPTYFGPAAFDGGLFCDGGLWANSPAMVAYAEACKIASACRRTGVDQAFTPLDIRMVSVGTGRLPYFVSPPVDGTAGVMYWAPRIIEVIGASQSQGVGFQADYLLGPDRYTRVDFDVQDRKWELDHVEVLDRLLHLGREAATARWAELADKFFGSPARPYTPYPNDSPGRTAAGVA